MSENAICMTAELKRLGYDPISFTAPKEQGGSIGVQFTYRIPAGSRNGETITLALALHENEGQWPEVAPHWVYISPRDDVLAEMVRGSTSQGVVSYHHDSNGLEWMAISAPPSDFWDTIDTADGKNIGTYLDRHIRRIWEVR